MASKACAEVVDAGESGGTAPHAVNFGARGMSVVSFMPQLHHSQENSHWYLQTRRLGEPQGQSEWFLEEKNLFPYSVEPAA